MELEWLRHHPPPTFTSSILRPQRSTIRDTRPAPHSRAPPCTAHLHSVSTNAHAPINPSQPVYVPTASGQPTRAACESHPSPAVDAAANIQRPYHNCSHLPPPAATRHMPPPPTLRPRTRPALSARTRRGCAAARSQPCRGRRGSRGGWRQASRGACNRGPPSKLCFRPAPAAPPASHHSPRSPVR